MKIRIVAFVIITLLLICASCASPPTAEMDSAREAVLRAENDADAVIYGSASLARARDALSRMQEEAENKRYDSAKTLAAEAIAAAERAIADGRAGASTATQQASQDSINLVEGLRDEVEETARNVNGARYSQLELDYDSLDNGIRNAHEMTDTAETSYANGDYQIAADTARVVRSDLADINNQVAAAVPRKK